MKNTFKSNNNSKNYYNLLLIAIKKEKLNTNKFDSNLTFKSKHIFLVRIF